MTGCGQHRIQTGSVNSKGRRTETHNESFYLPDQTIEDSIAVELFTPRGGRSNAAPYRMT